MTLADKVALVTGGASGIGASCVDQLLKHKIKGIVVADIISDEDTAKSHNDKYGPEKVLFVKTDVRDKDSFDNAFQKAVEKYGNIDILVNCAGIGAESDLEKLIQVNLVGVAYGCQLAIYKYFTKYKSSDNAFIINIASLFGIAPAGSLPHYSASKYGVVGLTRAYGANKNVAQQGVCVMALCPGVTETPMLLGVNASNMLHLDLCLEELSNLPTQKPEVVGRGVVEMLQKPDNGSIWLVNQDVLNKIKDLPNLSDFNVKHPSNHIC